MAIKPGSLYYFLSLSCSSSVWQAGGQGSGSSGTKWGRGSLWQVLMTASGRQKLRFYSLTECLPGPSSLRALWLTPSWEEASPDASINTIRSHQKDDPFSFPENVVTTALNCIKPKSFWIGVTRGFSAAANFREDPIISTFMIESLTLFLSSLPTKEPSVWGPRCQEGHSVYNRERARGHSPGWVLGLLSFPWSTFQVRTLLCASNKQPELFSAYSILKRAQEIEKHTQRRNFDHLCQKSNLTLESP